MKAQFRGSKKATAQWLAMQEDAAAEFAAQMEEMLAPDEWAGGPR